MITRSDLAAAFRAHRPLLIFTALYGVATVVAGCWAGARADEFFAMLRLFLGIPVLLSVAAPLLMLGLYGLRAAEEIVFGEQTPVQAMARWRGTVATYLRGPQLANGIAGTLVVLPLMLFFCAAKSLIPVLHGYHFDPTLARLDRFIHGGHYSFEFFLPLFRNSFVFRVIDTFYEVYWFLALYLLTSFAVWVEPDATRRQQFLWSFCLGWVVIGTVCALTFSSVGPNFYAEYYPDLPAPYADLLRALAHQNTLRPTTVARTIELLHTIMADRSRIIKLNAISAMPSMHVAIAALTCCYLWSVNRAWRWLGIAYLAMIFTGSVMLGWHYAIDGYVAAGLMAGIWWITSTVIASAAKQSIQQ